MMCFHKFVIFAFVFLASVASLASVGAVEQNERVKATAPQYDEYYTIEEKGLSRTNLLSTYSDFAAFSPELAPQRIFAATKATVLNLLKWTLHSEMRPIPSELYIRKLHFGRWINDPTDDTCMNTRAKILVRESDHVVTYRNEKNCVVDTGKWTDHYSDRDLMTAREIQIDHMVPLKHAYVSGAWKWDYKTRCLYANYMGYRNHLIPSSVHENTSKGDRGPQQYLPPNRNYRCQYLKDWLAVKLIWRMTMTSDEVQAIQNVVEENNCDISDFAVSKKELKDQRDYINDNIEYCMINKR